MYEVKFYLDAQMWGVEKDDVVIRLFSTHEAAQRYADNKNEE